jgi:DeoR/GlpR family transcriptional regulator of sugar metabolism
VARALALTFHGVVATSSLLVAGELAGHAGIDVLVAGGRVRGGDLSCSNAHSVALFASLNADVAFVSSGGLDARAGLSDFHLDEVATRLQMMANARATYVLADSSKFGVIAPYAVCGWTKLDGVICERPPSAPLARAITSGGGRIISD